MAGRRALLVLVTGVVALHFVLSPRGGAPWCVHYFTVPARILLAGVFALSFVSPLVTGLESGIRSLLGALESRSPRGRDVLYAAIASAAVVPFWALSDDRRLGDGHGLVWLISQGFRYDPHSPLGIYVQQSLFQVAHAHFGSTVEQSWGITSCVFGALFVFLWLRFSDEIARGRAEKALFLGLVIGLASTQLFFSEIEDYAGSTAFVLAYLYFGQQACRGKRGVLLPSAALGLALVFSMSTAFFVPSWAYLVVLGARQKSTGASGRAPARAVAWGILGAFGPLAAVLGCFQVFGKVDIVDLYAHRSHVATLGLYVRLFGAPRSTFSLEHLADLAQLNLLVAPFSAALVLGFAVPAYRRGAFADPFIRFVTTVTVCAWVFLLFWIPGFAMKDDWDLFSMFALPTTVLAFLLATRSSGLRADPRGFLRLVLVALVHAAVWVVTGHAWKT